MTKTTSLLRDIRPMIGQNEKSEAGAVEMISAFYTPPGSRTNSAHSHRNGSLTITLGTGPYFRNKQSISARLA